MADRKIPYEKIQAIKDKYLSDPGISLMDATKSVDGVEYNLARYYFTKEKWKEAKNLVRGAQVNSVNRIAGELTAALEREIVDGVKKKLVQISEKAVAVIDEVIDGNIKGQGAGLRLSASQDVLDRVGVKAPDRVEHAHLAYVEILNKVFQVPTNEVCTSDAEVKGVIVEGEVVKPDEGK